MHPRRRALLLALATMPTAGQATPEDDDPVRRGRELRFPRDHGAHPGSRIEWWYATGWLERPGATPLGFQITFFRSRTGLAADLPGRFAPRQLLFAHAALSDVGAGRHRHAQRIARWSGDEAVPEARARRADTEVSIGPWRLQREALADGASRYRSSVADDDAGFRLALQLDSTQPVLLQGERGWSRKGPDEQHASHYYSQPQLAVQARLVLDGRSAALNGHAWLDHEWSDQVLPAGAQGWDWLGINLADGGALTAFRLRRPDGSALWAGGSHRAADGRQVAFGPQDLRFEPERWWTSPSTGARYPVQWRLDTPLGRFGLRALMDAQELDSRGNTGAVYWEGLSDLVDAQGRPAGRGYLEMTGYAAALKL